MGRKILIVLWHITVKSFCGALADAYGAGVKAAGGQVRRLDLHRAQELITWADHVVFVYPNWWGSMPALMKGFLDRVLTSGFAFSYRSDGLWDSLLAGRTADLLVTMDTPPWYYRWIFKMPGHEQMRRTILGFCGIKVKKFCEFGVVQKSTPEKRQKWLTQATNLGKKSMHA